ncbi:MAG: DUF1292 domain-containing protein [Tissierellaceae bacterium]
MDKKKEEEFDHHHHHDHDHDHDHEFDFEDLNEDIIILTLDDDTELECLILGVFEVEDEEYIALQPIDDEDVLLYRYNEINDEDFELTPIENQEEFDIVSEAFDALFLEDEDFLEYEDDELED